MSVVPTGANPPYVVTSPSRFGRPRFWSTVWSLANAGKNWAENTQLTRLRHLNRFYLYCDDRFGSEALDIALGEANASLVHVMVNDFYVELTSNKEYTFADVQCWDAVRMFILHFSRYWAVGSEEWRSVVSAMTGTGRIRDPKRGRVKFIRALPDVTLTEFLAVAEPGASRNPFGSLAIQVRNWLVVLLLLLCGLRRGEALLLTVDSLKQDLDRQSGEVKYWLDVTNTADNEDRRSSKPSIKTADSHRQVPISADVARLIEMYVAEHRSDDGETRFLLTAEDGVELSKESVNKLLAQLSAAIPSAALQRFTERTGGKKRISSHDLRHTCATVRYGLFIAAEPDRELAFQRMRAFFGWAIESDMPALYARAAIEDDLMKSWTDVFDKRVDVLRGMTV
ncbi:tyrosine-type recombinase/integrase [Burkholderia oklahomensis]|uniref:Phage integrase family protein n=1 Tax=Burkholderia oklahomensis TaxID=342113 RepID=A0AAI8B476_9BURK|nr:tyrosine-type recombinase/integrase [Burkholderia oklahomensis]AIO65271.1 phage integrase family protein [Burkholderia oklahomensis]QPS35809.1 tyrosine-type recombinase/integrase [Burkholderia oklahomensis]